VVDFHRIRNPENNRYLTKLLSDFELTLPEGADDNLGVFDNGELIGCGFLKGNMLQGLAVDRSRQGEGLSASLVTELIKMAAERGITHLNVITKPSMAGLLSGIGLKLVAEAPPYASFLEYGTGNVAAYIQNLKKLAEEKPESCACLVMNCNPFTKGHRYLVEKASSESEWVWLLVVQEDLSVFPFEHRFELICEGTKDLKNVCVIPGGEYVISSVTFPSYFTRDENLAAAQGAMDAAIFAEVIAPALRVKRRFVGTEPTSKSTNLYNRALQERLPPKGIEVIEIERVAVDGTVVSASKVRESIKNDDWDEVKKMVPDSTYRYLTSPMARQAIEKIKAT